MYKLLEAHLISHGRTTRLGQTVTIYNWSVRSIVHLHGFLSSVHTSLKPFLRVVFLKNRYINRYTSGQAQPRIWLLLAV